MANANAFDDCDNAMLDAWANALGVARGRIGLKVLYSKPNVVFETVEKVPINIAFLSLTATNSKHEMEARRSEVKNYVAEVTRFRSVITLLNDTSDAFDLTDMEMKVGDFYEKVVAKSVDEVQIIFNGHGTKEGKMKLSNEAVNIGDLVNHVAQLIDYHEATDINVSPLVIMIFAQCHSHVNKPSEEDIHSKIKLVYLTTDEQPQTISKVSSTNMQLMDYARRFDGRTDSEKDDEFETAEEKQLRAKTTLLDESAALMDSKPTSLVDEDPLRLESKFNTLQGWVPIRY